MESSQKTKRAMSDFYSKVSVTYGKTDHDFFSYFGRFGVDLLQIESGSRVLDIATGKGAMLFPAAAKVGALGSVTGIDIAPGMMEATGAEVKAFGIENVSLKLMDAEKLDFPDHAFDYISCGFAIFFFPNINTALREMLRVLKPTGRIVISTWFKDPSSAFAGGGWFWSLIGKYLDTTPATTDDPEFGTEEGMRKILIAAGISDLSFVIEEQVYHYQSKEEWWQELYTNGARMALERIPQERFADFKEEVFAKLDDFREETGIYSRIPVLFSFGGK